MVRLRQAKKQYLTLCEVDVYATAGKFRAQLENEAILTSTLFWSFSKNTSHLIVFVLDILFSQCVPVKNDKVYSHSTLAPFSFHFS